MKRSPYRIRNLIENYLTYSNEINRLRQMRDLYEEDEIPLSSRQLKQLEVLKEKEDELNDLERLIDAQEFSDLEIIILDCLMDGMNITNLAKHLGISRRYVYVNIEKIVDRLI